jgi:hypothetical protein
LALTGWDKRVVKPSEVAEDIDPYFTSRNSMETFHATAVNEFSRFNNFIIGAGLGWFLFR